MTKSQGASFSVVQNSISPNEEKGAVSQRCLALPQLRFDAAVRQSLVYYTNILFIHLQILFSLGPQRKESSAHATIRSMIHNAMQDQTHALQSKKHLIIWQYHAAGSLNSWVLIQSCTKDLKQGALSTSNENAGIPQWAVGCRNRQIPGIPQILPESRSPKIQG